MRPETEKAAVVIPELDRLKAALTAGEIVDRPLPQGAGEIKIERLQPFVCIYRQPEGREDAGTRQLLSGQASSVLGSTSMETEAVLAPVISGLTELMLDAYGAALVLEIWSAPELAPVSQIDTEVQPVFRIIAERHGVPRETIEALEAGLLAEPPFGRPSIKVAYRSRAAPPGRRPVLTEQMEERPQVYLLGLEVPPVFRDPESGRVVPDALRVLTRYLGRAIRQAFYAFSHARARMRPAHFHELGPQAMAENVAEVDRGLAGVADSFDLLLHATPVNVEAAFERFLSEDCEAPPEFLYRPMTVDPGALKLALYQVPVHAIEDPALHHVYQAQRDELDRQITMLADRGTPRFLLESRQVFGSPDEDLKKTAKSLLALAPQAGTAGSPLRSLGAEEFARRAEDEITHYRRTWPDLPARVEIRADIPGVMVSKGHFLVGQSASVRQDRVEPLLQHEIGTHILTHYNGLRQPLSQFHTGMPGYEATQEGLAVLSEHLCGGLPVRRLRMLAARVVAVDSVIQGADFVETYRLLNVHLDFPERDAFTIAMRVHRGGGLTKDMVYLRGLIDLLDFLSEGHALEDLFLGKVTIDHMEIVEELRWRRIVSDGPLRPRYLDDPSARKRLERLPPGTDLAALVSEEAR